MFSRTAFGYYRMRSISVLMYSQWQINMTQFSNEPTGLNENYEGGKNSNAFKYKSKHPRAE
jgi:hypothetical protein